MNRDTGNEIVNLIKIVPAALLAGALAACGGDRPQAAPTVLAASVALASDEDLAAGHASYSVINLGPGQINEFPVINAHGQVAFSLTNGAQSRAFFFDGDGVADIGTLGGAAAFARGLNDAGQIAGVSQLPSGNEHAFRWSAAAGMRDLGTLGNAPASRAAAINQQGQVAGYSDFLGPLMQPLHAFAWNETDGMRDLGTLSNGLSVAQAINDRGQVIGYAAAADSNAHAFLWSRLGGMRDLGTLGGADSYAIAINNAGQVIGYAMDPISPDYIYRGFFWEAGRGMVDLGTLDGSGSSAMAINAFGQVAGMADTAEGWEHATSWTRRGGLVDLGTLGGDASNALGLNNFGQLVGWSLMPGTPQRYHAFVARAGRAMLDLNQRIPRAPAGLELHSAFTLNDQGAIVAMSNAGLVLLLPGSKGTDAPVVGPIGVDEPVAAGTRHVYSASFRDQNRADTHHASWSWGDDCALQADTLTQRQGGGVASASHTYCQEGLYLLSLTVTDSTGRSSTVSRDVAVYGFDDLAAGIGNFLSPRGASMRDPMDSGPARFSFVAQGKDRLAFRFNAGKLAFQASSATLLSAEGQRAQFQGTGKLNGKEGYRFVLSVLDGAAEGKDRVRIRIAHGRSDDLGEIVDYDNQGVANTLLGGAEGSPVSGGNIIVR